MTLSSWGNHRNNPINDYPNRRCGSRSSRHSIDKQTRFSMHIPANINRLLIRNHNHTRIYVFSKLHSFQSFTGRLLALTHWAECNKNMSIVAVTPLQEWQVGLPQFHYGTVSGSKRPVDPLYGHQLGVIVYRYRPVRVCAFRKRVK